MNPEGDRDLTTYFNKSLRMNKEEQQNNNFCFPTPKNCCKNEDHTAKIRHKDVNELQDLKEKIINPIDDAESLMKILQRFDWTDTLLTKVELQEVEDISVEHYDISARHRMDIGMNTEFKGETNIKR